MSLPDEELLSAYLDGECSDAERAIVEQWLAESPEANALLDEIRTAREAVRSLPPRDADPAFWARILGDTDAETETARDTETALDTGAVVELDERRRRRPARWVAGAAAAVVAAVIAAVVLVPQPESVTPPVASFTDAHAVRSSLQEDAISTLAPLAVRGGFRR